MARNKSGGGGFIAGFARGIAAFVRACSTPVGRRVLAVVGVVSITSLTLWQVRGYVYGQDRFVPRRYTLRLLSPRPGGPVKEMIDDIEAVPLSGRSVFDATLLADVRATYARYPWVAEVPRVRRILPDGIEATIRLRWPVGAVLVGNGYYLIDEESIRLPRKYYEHVQPAKEPDMPFLAGIRGLPPAVGQACAGRDLAEGLAVARVLRGLGLLRRAKIATVDVRNVGGRLDPRAAEVVLVTQSGAQIEWGRSPLQSRIGEPTTEEKVAALVRVLASPVKLEDVAVVRLQFPGPIIQAR